MNEHITIGDVAPRALYVADGSQADFTFPFPIFAPADLEVRLFDAAGREAVTLARGAMATRTGVVRIDWDGRRADGSRAAPGVYFVRAVAPSAAFQLTRRLVVLQ